MSSTAAPKDLAHFRRGLTRTSGLRIPINYIVSAARRRAEADARAMRWLANYAAICEIEFEEFLQPLGLTDYEMKRALTGSDCAPETVQKFTSAVLRLRRQFEASIFTPDPTLAPAPYFRPGSAFHDGYRALAQTTVAKTVQRACKAALKHGTMAEVIGLTRIGKTSPAAQWLHQHLDDAVYLNCPEAASERDFLIAFARACGCSFNTTGNSMAGPQLRVRIEEAFARGGFRMVIVDEAHNIWRRSQHQSPVRLEFLRRLRDQYGVAVVLLATPQFTDELAASFGDGLRWAPGQYDGRVHTYRLADTLSDEDLTAVARHHAPSFSASEIEKVVEFAKRSHGYCGAMVNVIQRATEAMEDRGSLTTEGRAKLLDEIIRRQEKGRGASLQADGKIVELKKGGRKAA